MDIELFDKRYIYLEWSDELEGKDCILAKSYKDLKDFVNSGDEGRFCKVNKGREKPFTNGWSECDFCYYDPNLKVKKAWIDGKILEFKYSDDVNNIGWQVYNETHMPHFDTYDEYYEWRIKSFESEDSTFNSINDCATENEKGEIMNDYLFYVKVTDKNGGNIRETKCVVSAKNVESAYEKIDDKLFKNNIIVYGIIDVKKL